MDKDVNVNWKTLNNLLGYESIYDEKSDILLIQTNKRRTAISVDCDGEYWIRVDPETGEILGVEIEAFKKVFLKKHRKAFNRQTTYVRPITELIELEQCSSSRLMTA